LGDSKLTKNTTEDLDLASPQGDDDSGVTAMALCQTPATVSSNNTNNNNGNNSIGNVVVNPVVNHHMKDEDDDDEYINNSDDENDPTSPDFNNVLRGGQFGGSGGDDDDGFVLGAVPTLGSIGDAGGGGGGLGGRKAGRPAGGVTVMGAEDPDQLPESPKEGGIQRRMKPQGLAMTEAPPPTIDMSDSGRFQEGLFQIHSRGLVVGDSNMADAADAMSVGRNPSSSAVTFDLGPDDFKNLEVVGNGASSYVRKALHKKTHTVMALKVINVFDQDKRKQLMTEIQTLFNSECPQLVTFHGAFSHEGSISIALEYATAGSLTDLIHLCPNGIDERIAALIMEQILLGLRFMHKDRHQIHRDLKPSNLLADHSGRVMLTDFGVATTLNDSSALCATFVGTYLYMSPERFHGEKYSYPVDIWSVGLILHEMLTGHYPWKQNRGYWEMMSNIVNDPSPELAADGPFSDHARHFVAQCLQKLPEQRMTVVDLCNHPFITSHCGIPAEEKQKIIADWIASLRTVFVCLRDPSNSHEVGKEFMLLYRSLFSCRRGLLSSLYRDESQFELNAAKPVSGKADIMALLLRFSMMLTPDEEADWKENCSAGPTHNGCKTILVRSVGVVGFGNTPYREDFVLVEEHHSRSYWILNQKLVIGE